jgi:CheY-like chemotaxis protein
VARNWSSGRAALVSEQQVAVALGAALERPLQGSQRHRVRRLHHRGRMADILVVDDNVDLAQLVELLLVSENHRVRVAHDGEAGMVALAAGLPDVVVLDVDMPVLDGPGMAYRMLVEDCGREMIPIVLLSGSVDLAAAARRVGTPFVLRKPSDPEWLLAMVRRALTERTPPSPRPPG